MQQAHSPHPVTPSLLLLLCAVYLLLGLVDHDLWKHEDAVHLGVAWDMARNGHWLKPELAGEPWPGAPLYYWLAAAFGQTMGGLMSFHNAARLATAACGALLLFALGRASAANLNQTHHGRSAFAATGKFDRAALLLLIGSPGLLIPIHEAQPMIAVLAGHALVYWGLARLPSQRSAGLLLATGLLFSVLAGGLNALLPLAPLLLLPLFSLWRNRSSLQGWLIAGLLAGGLITLWSGTQTAQHFDLVQENAFSLNHFELLAWFAWPVLPVAIWSIWLHRRHINNPQFLLPLTGSLGSLLVFLAYAEPRNLPALPMLVPFTLLAAIGAGRMRRGAANALDWFGMITFTLTASLVWLGAIAWHFGTPAKIHAKLTRFAPGLAAETNWPLYLFAFAISLIWLALIFLSRRSPWRATTHWACGVTLTWALIAALWMPIINHGKSYRSVAENLQAKLGKSTPACIGGRGLSEAHNAVLHYYAGIITVEGRKAETCNWLIVHSNLKRPNLPGSGWNKVLETSRPGEKHERFYLYKR